MKTPMPPPNFELELGAVLASDRAADVLNHGAISALTDRYYSWDELRYREPPQGLTHNEWWVATKLARNASRRSLPLLLDTSGRPFSYVLCDELLEKIEEVAARASGKIGMSDPLNLGTGKRQYIVTSLIEEAITSSQLEGAATTRQVAKAMIRSGRKPRNHSEKMIVNNYETMQAITEMATLPLTPELVCKIHAMVTKGTLEDRGTAGKLQINQAERVAIWDEQGTLLHRPPAATELPERLRRLCDFANDVPQSEDATKSYLPPLLRALAIHFMVGYDHYFIDGNGRTARALFYWSLLNQGFWLAEYIPISRLLLKAQSQYARSFLLTEQDDGDLTHFFIYHARVLVRAIDDLHGYIERKRDEALRGKEALRGLQGALNHRQLALLNHALQHPDEVYTAYSHSASHQVTPQSARNDLIALEGQKLLLRTKRGRAHAWVPNQDALAALVQQNLVKSTSSN